MCLTTTEGWTYHAPNRNPTFCDVLSRVFAHTRSSLGFRDAVSSGLGRGRSRKQVEAVARSVSMSVVNLLLISTRFGALQQACYRRVQKDQLWHGHMKNCSAGEVSIQTTRGLGKSPPDRTSPTSLTSPSDPDTSRPLFALRNAFSNEPFSWGRSRKPKIEGLGHRAV